MGDREEGEAGDPIVSSALWSSTWTNGVESRLFPAVDSSTLSSAAMVLLELGLRSPALLALF